MDDTQTWEMNDREFRVVSALPAAERYDHFVKRAADWGAVWGIRSPGGWRVMAGDDGRETLPVWPHPRFAGACAVGEWADSEPAAISLDDWLEKWTPGLAGDGRLVAVFPVDARGVVVTPKRLADDLGAELAKLG